MSNSSRITGSGKPAGPRVDTKPAPPPPPPPSWAGKPPAAEVLAALAVAIHHFLGIRATGSLPDKGGPSMKLTANPSQAELTDAAQLAADWWPNAASFEIVGSDLRYRDDNRATAVDQPVTDHLPATMHRLRDAAVITTYTQAPASSNPAPPPIPRRASADQNNTIGPLHSAGDQ
jgi:hypothetical protein